ncbi:WxL domain-containing protein [Vagococcus carniphilus]|nr:WxL domain-containing protein [Vagococcus carniphilus]QNN72464.1 WxL domain-containing protein [Vagococcus carniphilus]
MRKKIGHIVIAILASISFSTICFSETVEDNHNVKTSLVDEDIEQYQDFDPDNEWIEISTIERGAVDLGNNQKLAYLFGPEMYLSQNKDIPVNLGLPNIYFENDGANVFAYYQAQYTLQTSRASIVGDRPGNFRAIMPSMSGENTHYYKKTMLNGLPAYLVIIDDDVVNMRSSTIVYGMQSGFVRVNTRYTNIGGKTQENIVVGAAYDTMLNGNDDVPIKFLGKNKGLYIEVGEYKLEYRFNVPDGPTNWMGGEFLTPATFIKQQGSMDKGFNSMDSIGMENSNKNYGEIAADNIDTGISMKSQPLNLKVGQNFDMGYIVGIQKDDGDPVITLNENDQTFEGGDFEISGEWFDNKSDLVNLYYSVDDGKPIRFAENLSNINPGEAYEWKTTIPNLSKNNHKVKVYLISSNQEKSKERTVNLSYVIKPKLKETVFREDSELANQAYPGEKLKFKIELASINDVSATYNSLKFISPIDKYLENLSEFKLTTEDGRELKINSSEIKDKKLSLTTDERVPLSQKIILEFFANIKQETPVGTKINSLTQLEGTTDDGLSISKASSNSFETEIIPVKSKVEAKVHHEDGTLAESGILGEKLIFSGELKPNEMLREKEYEKMSVETILDENLEKVTDVKLTTKEGIEVGTGVYDKETKRVKAELTQPVSPQETLHFSFKANIKIEANIGSQLKFTVVFKDGVAGGISLEKSNSNEVTVKIKEGHLEFVTSPTHLSFGNNLSISSQKETYSVFSKDEDLQVQDNRAGKKNWRMTARLISDFKTTENEKLKETFLFKTKEVENPITTSAETVIVERNSEMSELVNLSQGWNAEEGLMISVPPGVAKSKEYQAKMQWNLQDVPENKN